ncbi:hypothetical protein [Herbaspirillum sp.]|uniref:hypothetical protein n=1 Tax=Herbaspirillum sp. TaxID=1890675 RepID=UPI00257D4560|nr:hypothetical protein [Herbaspirillum sp.]
MGGLLAERGKRDGRGPGSSNDEIQWADGWRICANAQAAVRQERCSIAAKISPENLLWPSPSGMDELAAKPHGMARSAVAQALQNGC